MNLSPLARTNSPDKLAIGRFDSTVYKETLNFLSTLKRYYGNKLTKAADEKDRRVAELTSTPEKMSAYELERLTYANDAVSDAVLNVSAIERILEYNGRLIQKIYPVYHDEHNPEHFIDFSANLYRRLNISLAFTGTRCISILPLSG